MANYKGDNEMNIPGTNVKFPYYDIYLDADETHKQIETIKNSINDLANYTANGSDEWKMFYLIVRTRLYNTELMIMLDEVILNNSDWDFRLWVLTESIQRFNIINNLDRFTDKFPWYQEWKTIKAIMK